MREREKTKWRRPLFPWIFNYLASPPPHRSALIYIPSLCACIKTQCNAISNNTRANTLNFRALPANLRRYRTLELIWQTKQLPQQQHEEKKRAARAQFGWLECARTRCMLEIINSHCSTCSKCTIALEFRIKSEWLKFHAWENRTECSAYERSGNVANFQLVSSRKCHNYFCLSNVMSEQIFKMFL